MGSTELERAGNQVYEGLGADRVNGWSTYRLTGDNLRNLKTPD